MKDVSVNKVGWFHVVGSVVIGLVYLLFSNFTTVDLIQDGYSSFESYDDSGTNGTSYSKVMQQKNGEVCFSYVLNQSDVYKYAGIKVKPQESQYFDWSVFNQITIEFSSPKQGLLNVFQITAIDSAISANGKKPYAYAVEIEKGVSKKSFYLDELETPTWWYKNNKQDKKTDENRKGNERTISFNIENNSSSELGVEEQICIRSIVLSKNNNLLFLAAFISLTLFNGVLFFWKSLKRKKEVTISYVAVPQKELIYDTHKVRSDLEEVVEYISIHYSEVTLSLPVIRKALGITEQRISQSLKQAYNISYTDYVQKIRIEAAKVLLDKAKYQIGEVAVMVGFGHISSFNRVFKKWEDVAPSEYVRKKKI